MSLTVKISIKDDKGKEADIQLQETDELSKLVIIQNVFNLFGIERDILDTIKEFDKIGKAYSNFFESMNQEEDQTITDPIQKSEDIREKMIEGLTKLEETKEDIKEETTRHYIETGIKIDNKGKKRFRLRYECPICVNKGNHYVYEGSTETWCHSCNSRMPIKAAHKDGFPNRDSYENY